MMIPCVVSVISAYLIGSIPFPYIFGKVFGGVDIREVGSKNMGAMNVYRICGAIPGALCMILEFGKGAGAFFVARAFGVPIWVYLFSGIFCVLGHDFPLFLKFRGGKGAGCAIGYLLSLMPFPTLSSLGVISIPFFITRNASFSSAIGFLLLPLFSWVFLGGDPDFIFYLVSSIAIPIVVGLKQLPTVIQTWSEAPDRREAIRRLVFERRSFDDRQSFS